MVMSETEQRIFQEHFDDLKAERDDLRAERDRLLKQVAEMKKPLVQINTGLDTVWNDLMAAARERGNEPMLFGIWLLVAAVVGATGWIVIYSVVKFWSMLV